jgi:HD domain
MHQFPDTPIVKEAAQLARANLSAAIFQHSQRAFLLGKAYAEARRLAFDEEDLFLAALFHDLGLSESFANPRKAFTEIGADLVEQFLTRHGDPSRGCALAEAIALHMQLLPRWSKGPVVGLLQVGAWMDASKLRSGSVGRAVIASIEAEFPRTGFELEFRSRLFRSFGSLRACTRLAFPAARAQPS